MLAISRMLGLAKKAATPEPAQAPVSDPAPEKSGLAVQLKQIQDNFLARQKKLNALTEKFRKMSVDLRRDQDIFSFVIPDEVKATPVENVKPIKKSRAELNEALEKKLQLLELNPDNELFKNLKETAKSPDDYLKLYEKSAALSSNINSFIREILLEISNEEDKQIFLAKLIKLFITQIFPPVASQLPADEKMVEKIDLKMQALNQVEIDKIFGFIDGVMGNLESVQKYQAVEIEMNEMPRLSLPKSGTVFKAKNGAVDVDLTVLSESLSPRSAM